MREVKERTDIQLFEITKKNRDSLLKEISDFVSQPINALKGLSLAGVME